APYLFRDGRRLLPCFLRSARFALRLQAPGLAGSAHRARGRARDLRGDKAKAEGREVRGPVDHRFVRSIYFRDPNGYVIELTASTGKHGEIMDPAISKPHEALAHWQATKSH